MIWDLSPSFVRLVDASHVRVLLVFDPHCQAVIGAGLAEDGEAAAALIVRLIARWGEPTFVRALPNPLFRDLEDAVGAVLSARGLHPTAEPADDDVLWVLSGRQTATRSIEGPSLATLRHPATPRQLAIALHGLTRGPSPPHVGPPDG